MKRRPPAHTVSLYSNEHSGSKGNTMCIIAKRYIFIGKINDG
jgi:hypothetical protein